MNKQELIKIANWYKFTCSEDLYQVDSINEILGEIVNTIFTKEFGVNWNIDKEDKE